MIVYVIAAHGDCNYTNYTVGLQYKDPLVFD